MIINENYKNLEESYLFSNIAKKREAYKAANPSKKVISLGIGDVTLPLVPEIVDALVKASKEMGVKETFRGYGAEQGYEFLRDAIRGYYACKGVELYSDEIFINDGAKSDLGNFLDILSEKNTVLIPDPVYPAYVDVNIMAGRKIIYAKGNEQNGFLPMPDYSVDCDIIYLCSPNNPTGAVYSHSQLAEWVKYAKTKNAIILFDAAYEIFIEGNAPSSIYEIDGAKDVSIEFCSLSKMAGFTGMRCGWTNVPRGTFLGTAWLRRQTTKFNGVPYIIQRGAAAVFSENGLAQIRKNIAYYLQNAKLIAQTMDELNWWYVGGKNSPYIWGKCPMGLSSWEFFDKLLNELAIVITPGAGFGKMGEGYFRLSSFGDYEDVAEAMERLKTAYL